MNLGTYIARHSYILLSILLVLAGIAYAPIAPRPDIMVLIILLASGLFIVYWVLARRGNLTPVNPEKRIRRGRSSDRPVVVYCYSDWSLGSLLKRPLTAAAERKYKGRCDFIYIEASHRDAEGAMQSLEADVGDWVLFDGAGTFVEMTGRLTEAKLEQLVHRPAH